MRLIDADKLKSMYSIDRANFNTVVGIQKWIDNAPTVQAIPIEVLQKIRQEIDNLTVIWPEGGIGMISKFLVMDIIDNHIKEGET